jgi:hypothetical protein
MISKLYLVEDPPADSKSTKVKIDHHYEYSNRDHPDNFSGHASSQRRERKSARGRSEDRKDDSSGRRSGIDSRSKESLI